MYVEKNFGSSQALGLKNLQVLSIQTIIPEHA